MRLLLVAFVLWSMIVVLPYNPLAVIIGWLLGWFVLSPLLDRNPDQEDEPYRFEDLGKYAPPEHHHTDWETVKKMREEG